MGYYSTVRILATKNAAKKIFEATKDTGLPFDTTKVSPSGNTYYFEGCTKWYEDDPECFPEVKAIMDTLDDLDEADYRYIRVGEESGDVDDYGCGDNADEAEIYGDGKDDCIDAWFDVDDKGNTIESSPVERLTPFWEEFRKKAEMFGIKITKNLPEIID